MQICLDFCLKLYNFTKNYDFSVLLLKGYCFTKLFFTLFCKISYFMKHQLKLSDSNMKVHGFFSPGAIFQACEMISDFLIYRKLRGQRTRKSIKNTKNIIFSTFSIFFQSFESFVGAERVLNF